MRKLLWLLPLFVVVPLIEFSLLWLLGGWLGFWPTVGVIVVTGVVGTLFAKKEGLRVWRQWKRALGELRLPEEGVLSGLLLLAGGVLLITPGVLTDILGLSLLIGPARNKLAALIEPRVKRSLDDKLGKRTRGVVRLTGALGGGSDDLEMKDILDAASDALSGDDDS